MGEDLENTPSGNILRFPSRKKVGGEHAPETNSIAHVVPLNRIEQSRSGVEMLSLFTNEKRERAIYERRLATLMHTPELLSFIHMAQVLSVTIEDMKGDRTRAESLDEAAQKHLVYFQEMNMGQLASCVNSVGIDPSDDTIANSLALFMTILRKS